MVPYYTQSKTQNPYNASKTARDLDLGTSLTSSLIISPWFSLFKPH